MCWYSDISMQVFFSIDCQDKCSQRAWISKFLSLSPLCTNIFTCLVRHVTSTHFLCQVLKVLKTRHTQILVTVITVSQSQPVLVFRIVLFFGRASLCKARTYELKLVHCIRRWAQRSLHPVYSPFGLATPTMFLHVLSLVTISLYT